jgi:predicted DNA-binding transcriptional regulator AlpA
MSKFIRRRKTAEMIGISQATLWRWTRSGHFPKPIQLGPNTVGWLEADIESWIASQATGCGSCAA